MSSPTTDLQLPKGATALQILKAARELISVPERWTQGAYAYDAKGTDLGCGYEPDAVCWCALGAIEHVSGAPYFGPAAALLEGAMGGFADIFNDSHTHAEVLAAFDRAIDAAGGSNGQ